MSKMLIIYLALAFFPRLTFSAGAMDLDEYLKGGQDSEHKQLREGYGYIPKPQARKIKEYLYGILEDAWRYSHDRRPGRRKKQSK